MIRRRWLFASTLALFAAFPLAAQQKRVGLPGGAADTTRKPARVGMIDGIVTDSNLAPLGSAQVTVLSTSVRVPTGANGRFRITNVPAGEYVLIVRRSGYRPTSNIVQVAAADTLRVSYSLERAPTVLGAVVVTEQRLSVKLAEFEYRKKLGVGEFMSQADIEKRNSVYTTELMRKFPSINVSPSYSKSSMAEWFALSKRETGSPMVGACPMQVVVDNMPMQTPFNLDMLPSPRNIAGIEVYNGPATIPPQFAGYNRSCGLILIWTRDGY
jgi:hypothetical protein